MGQLTDGLNALIRYANETTGASDATISKAVETLVQGYGQGGDPQGFYVKLPNSPVLDTNGYTCQNWPITEATLHNVEQMGQYAFQGCAYLTKFDAPDLVYAERNFFAQCYSLEEVNVPLLQEVYYDMFWACSSLVTLDLPSVTTIREWAFEDCSSLTTIILRNPEMVTLVNPNALTYAQHFTDNTGSIYVPDELVSDYQSDSVWVNFAQYIKPLSTLINP